MVTWKAGLPMTTAKRLEAYGWHVIRSIDGHSRPAIKAAIEQAHQQTAKTNVNYLPYHHRIWIS
ncbi:hypothetical protein MASR2M36_36570 [Providencia sp.]